MAADSGSKQTLIQMVGVTKVYKHDIIGLSDVSLTVNDGEFVFLTGQSGAGKSTLLRLLFREEAPTSGQIMVAGRSLQRLSSRETVMLRRNVGIVFQDFRLLERKTVYENVAFVMKAVEADWQDIQQRVPEVLDRMGVLAMKDKLPNELSGGEQQRVAIARALVNYPKILLADEPTGNLDPDTSWELMQLFDEINAEGTTILMATHAKDIVNQMNKRVLALRHGVLVGDEVGGWIL